MEFAWWLVCMMGLFLAFIVWSIVLWIWEKLHGGPSDPMD